MLVAGGSTNVTTYFALRKTADGTAATGLTITGFDLQYVRSGVAPVAKVDATALAATDSAHADNKAIEIDATDQPGLYRVDWPDAAFAAAVREVILTVKVATAFTEHLRVEIDGEVNVVEWGGTDVVAGAIPAAAADAAGGLPISDAGGLDLDAKLAATNEVTAVRMAALTDWINGGRLDLLLDAIKAVTDLLPDAGALTAIGTDTARLTAVRAAVLTDWINGGRLDLLLDAIPTTAMRGTDGALTDKAGFSLSTAGILAIWHQALTAIVTAGSIGKLLKDEITSARMATLTDWINGGRLDLILDIIAADVVNIDGAAMRGTDNAALASVLGALADAAAAGDPTSADTVMQYVKQLVNVLVGTAGIATFPAEAAPANLVSLAEVIRAIHADVTGLAGSVMRGTDGASTHGDPDPSGFIDAAITSRATPAQVNTEVADVLKTDTIPELAQAAPAATPTFETAIMLLYMAIRDKLDITATFKEIHNNAGTVIAKKALTDDGTTYSEAQMGTGP